MASQCAELSNTLAFRFLYAASRSTTCDVTPKTGNRDNLSVVKDIRNRRYMILVYAFEKNKLKKCLLCEANNNLNKLWYFY